MDTKIHVYYERLKNDKDDLVVKLQRARLLWNDLEEPRAFQEGDKLKYSATVLVPEDLLPEFDKAVNKVAEMKLGRSAAASLKKFRLDLPHNPIRKKVNEETGDTYYTLRATLPAEITTRAGGVKKRTPDVRRRNGTPVTWGDAGENAVDDEGNEIKQDRPYNGCYVNLLFDLYYTSAGKGGIFPALRMVQFVADGEPLGRARQSNDEFIEDLSDTGDSKKDDDFDDVPF